MRCGRVRRKMRPIRGPLWLSSQAIIRSTTPKRMRTIVSQRAAKRLVAIRTTSASATSGVPSGIGVSENASPIMRQTIASKMIIMLRIYSDPPEPHDLGKNRVSCVFMLKIRTFKKFYHVHAQIGLIIRFMKKLREQFQQPVIIRFIASLQ